MAQKTRFSTYTKFKNKFNVGTRARNIISFVQYQNRINKMCQTSSGSVINHEKLPKNQQMQLQSYSDTCHTVSLWYGNKKREISCGWVSYLVNYTRLGSCIHFQPEFLATVEIQLHPRTCKEQPVPVVQLFVSIWTERRQKRRRKIHPSSNTRFEYARCPVTPRYSKYSKTMRRCVWSLLSLRATQTNV